MLPDFTVQTAFTIQGGTEHAGGNCEYDQDKLQEVSGYDLLERVFQVEVKEYGKPGGDKGGNDPEIPPALQPLLPRVRIHYGISFAGI